MGVLIKADEMALQLLCDYADYTEARDELRALGSKYYTTTTQTGGMMHRVHPAVAVMQEADVGPFASSSHCGMMTQPQSTSRSDVHLQAKALLHTSKRSFACDNTSRRTIRGCEGQ
jgi:hypothetical protein